MKEFPLERPEQHMALIFQALSTKVLTDLSALGEVRTSEKRRV